MLTRIKIKGLALLDKAEVDLKPGLNVLTGETGGGKSIFVKAISLVLGERAEKDNIRHGSESLEVEAHFDINKLSKPDRLKFENYSSDNKICLSIIVSKEGSSKSKINNIQIGKTKLQQLSSSLAEIVGQHSSQMLMDEENHLDYLDQYGNHLELCNQVADLFYQYKTVSDKLNLLVRKKEELIAARELGQFQKNELEKADLQIGQEEKLKNELSVLNSARLLMQSTSQILNIISSEEHSLTDLINSITFETRKMADKDKSLDKQMERVNDLKFEVEEIRSAFEQYGSSLVDDPKKIEELNDRLDEIYRMKSKYGGSEEAALNKLDELKQQLMANPDVEKQISELEKEKHKVRKQYQKIASELSLKRKNAAKLLRKTIIKELKDLSIDNSDFDFQFLYEEDENGISSNGIKIKPTEGGFETGRILFSANKGEPLKSLVKTASGGEISRVLLALISIRSKKLKQNHRLLVFDEVDSGIGGQTAHKLAEKLKSLSGSNQLIVVTHLHQIARAADYHLVASKFEDKNKRTVIQLKSLDTGEIAGEIKRMIALPEEQNKD